MAVKGSGIMSPYKDCAVEYPSEKDGEGTRFGDELETLRGGEKDTKGQMKEVQFIDLHQGQGAGKVHFTKVEGGGTSNE